MYVRGAGSVSRLAVGVFVFLAFERFCSFLVSEDHFIFCTVTFVQFVKLLTSPLIIQPRANNTLSFCAKRYVSFVPSLEVCHKFDSYEWF